MSILLNKLAEAIGCTVSGDGDLPVKGIRFASEAEEDDLAIARSQKEILNTPAKAVLCAPHIVFTDKTLLFGESNIIISAVRAAEYMTEQGMYPDYSAIPQYTETSSHVFIGKNCSIGGGTVLLPMTFIGDNVQIGENCRIDAQVKIGSGTVIGDDVHIGFGSSIGADSFYHAFDGEKYIPFCGTGKVRIGSHTHIGCHTVIQRGTFSDTVIGENCAIANLIDIGHDVKIGYGCRIVSQSGIAGNAVLEDHVHLYGQSAVSSDIHVGRYAEVYGKSAASRNVAPGSHVFGLYGREAAAEIRREAELFQRVKERKQNGCSKR